MQWIRQGEDKELSAQLEWDKPERKDQAGKLLIVGGNLHGFSAPAKAYEYAQEFGIGESRIILPEALKKTLHSFWTDAIFAPSTQSGSFSAKALDIILQNAQWTDWILLAGDLGRNSETAVLLDNILRSTTTNVAITKDALDYYLSRPKDLLNRPNALVVASFSQAQKLFSAFGYKTPLRYDMPLEGLVETLGEITDALPIALVTQFGNRFIAGATGQVFSSQPLVDQEIWRLRLAVKATVQMAQHPAKFPEALFAACEV